MMPPICSICGKRDNTGNFGLIYFKMTKNDEKWKIDMKKNHKVGHPPYAVWFCGEHIKFAQKYKDLHKIDAMKLIKKDLENQ